MRRGLSAISRVLYVTVLTLAWFAPGTVQAASYTVSEESDFYFTVTEQTSTIIYGNSNAGCSNFSTDPYLWLYNDGPESDGSLVAQDDDSNHNSTDQCVSAKIATTLPAGDYRLRAGYCCSQRGLGVNPYNGATYELVLNFTAWADPGITTSVMSTTTTTVVATTSTSTTSSSTTTAPSTSTTTSTSTTSTSSTSTTIPATTSTTSSTTTPNTTTTSPPSSPTTDAVTPPPSTSTTTTTTTTIPPATTVEPAPVPVQPAPPPETTAPPATTSSPPTTTIAVTTTTVPSTTTIPPTTTAAPTTTIGSTTSTLPATTTTGPSATTMPSSTVRASTTTLEPSPSTTVKPPPATDAPRLAPAQIEAIADPAVQEAVVQIVTEPEDITLEEARSIFSAIDTLEPDTLAVVVSALSEAPPEVKAEFENEVNVYEGDFDQYVPAGSNVTVAQRRTIIVVTAATASPLSPLAPASVRRRKIA